MKISIFYKIALLLIIIIGCACSAQKSTNALGDNQSSERPVTKAVRAALPMKGIPDVKSCTCAQLWMPVCGDNGKTYSNACFATCAGVKFIQGSCTKIITD